MRKLWQHRLTLSSAVSLRQKLAMHAFYGDRLGRMPLVLLMGGACGVCTEKTVAPPA